MRCQILAIEAAIFPPSRRDSVPGLLLLAAAAPVLARPSAMKLFPEETLLLVRTPNAGELFERLRETATGRMVRDPQLAPFVERLYGSAGDLYTEKVAEVVGRLVGGTAESAAGGGRVCDRGPPRLQAGVRAAWSIKARTRAWPSGCSTVRSNGSRKTAARRRPRRSKASK